MTRKLFALATALLLAVALVVATAGPGGAQRVSARGDGPLKLLSRNAVPFATRQAQRVASKPVRALSWLEPAPALRQGKIAPNLAARLESSARAAERFDVVVTTLVDPVELKEALGGVEVKHTYRKALYGFSARVTQEQVLSLKALPQVESIGTDEKVHTMIDNAGRWTGATKARDDFSITGDGDGFEQRYTTKDVVIAVIDTGIDHTYRTS